MSKKTQSLAEIIRVNHAGEYGAKRIYEGQIAFSKHPQTTKVIKEMYESELEHLDYFSKEMRNRKVRPTILFPLWHVAGYALGAVTSMIGDKAAMACTSAIEEVIEDHYEQQIDDLSEEEGSLKNKITQFRSEEIEHKNTAEGYEIDQTPLYNTIKKLVTFSSKTAIWLSKKI